MSEPILIELPDNCSHYTLEMSNDMIHYGASYNNVVGVYFEDVDHNIIGNGIVMYPQTRKMAPYPNETVDVQVTANAKYMGYFLLSNPEGWSLWSGKQPFFKRFDEVEFRRDSNDTVYQPFTTREYYGLNIIETSNKIPEGEPHAGNYYYEYSENDTLVKEVNKRIGTNLWGGGVSFSNPTHNLEGVSMFMVEEDGSVLLEDMKHNTGWDFGIHWTKPRSFCLNSTHAGCNHD